MIRQFFKKIFDYCTPSKIASAVSPKNRQKKTLRIHSPHLGGAEILYKKQHQINRSLASNQAIRVCETLQEAGFRAYIVGGAVRDLLLSVSPKDFDVATNAEPEQIQRLFRRARIIGRRFRLVHVMFGSETIEVSTFRALQSDDADTDEHGRVLRDNVFGQQHEDAARRDFTINALYYDPHTETVLDYHNGVQDLRNKTLRIIGNPTTRYREDPVRMLRVVRFAAKLNFEIAPETQAPIASLVDLIRNIPSARLFDEMLKLLQSGSAMACLTRLRQEGLHQGLFPLLDLVLEHPEAHPFINQALVKTDQRVRAQKPISSGFLFACLLWHLLQQRWEQRKARGELEIPSLFAAMDDIFDQQLEHMSIPRKIISDIREIWAVQPRFEKRNGKYPWRLIEHQRFRAALDFLELRANTDSSYTELARWWRDFYESAPEQRNQIIQNLTLNHQGNGSSKKRQRRRKSESKPKITPTQYQDQNKKQHALTSEPQHYNQLDLQ